MELYRFKRYRRPVPFLNDQKILDVKLQFGLTYMLNNKWRHCLDSIVETL